MKRIVTILLAATVSLTAMAGVLEGISAAIKAGNARELVKYFDNSIEITIGEVEKVYSKNQSVQVISSFFTKNKPTSFKIIHQGSSGQGEYAIGTLVTSGGSYRTYLYMKSSGGTMLLQEIRFERD